MADDRCEASTTTGRRCKQKATWHVTGADGLNYMACKRHLKDLKKHPGVAGKKPAENRSTNMAVSTLKKPTLDTEAVLISTESVDSKKTLQKVDPKSGQVPTGDVRLTANIRGDLHLKLKIAAAQQRTTIGELIEEMVEKYI